MNQGCIGKIEFIPVMSIHILGPFPLVGINRWNFRNLERFTFCTFRSSFPCFLWEEEQAEITSDKHACNYPNPNDPTLTHNSIFHFPTQRYIFTEKRGTKKNPGVTPDSILKFTRSHYNASTTFFCSLKNIIRCISPLCEIRVECLFNE